MIIYFSGTGNSRYTAEVLSHKLDDGIVSINELLKNHKYSAEFESSKPFIVVTPTYAWRLPLIVQDFLSKSTFSGNNKIYFVMTCSADTGQAELYLKKFCIEKELDFMGLQDIVMPENYVLLFEVPSREDSVNIIKKARPIIEKLAGQILKTEKLSEHELKITNKFKSSILHKLFQLIVRTNKFYTTDNCNGCGECASLCYLDNIKIENGRPVWGKNCTHCSACINVCKQKAIEYGKKTKNRERFFNDLK